VRGLDDFYVVKHEIDMLSYVTTSTTWFSEGGIQLIDHHLGKSIEDGGTDTDYAISRLTQKDFMILACPETRIELPRVVGIST